MQLLLQGRQRPGVALRCEQRPAHTAAGERQSGVDRYCRAVRLQRQPVASLLAERLTGALVCARVARVTPDVDGSAVELEASVRAPHIEGNLKRLETCRFSVAICPQKQWLGDVDRDYLRRR